MRKRIGWILRKIAGDRQMKARPSTVSKLHRVLRKLYYGRLAQLHLDFVATPPNLLGRLS